MSVRFTINRATKTNETFIFCLCVSFRLNFYFNATSYLLNSTVNCTRYSRYSLFAHGTVQLMCIFASVCVCVCFQFSNCFQIKISLITKNCLIRSSYLEFIVFIIDYIAWDRIASPAGDWRCLKNWPRSAFTIHLNHCENMCVSKQETALAQ